MIYTYLPGKIWLSNIANKELFLTALIMINFLMLSSLFLFKYTRKNDILREYLNLSVLGLLFYTTPLIISFGTYFTLWHSLGSTLEQIQFLRKANSKSNLINFYIESVPIIIISFVLLFIIILVFSNFNFSRLQNKLDSVIACLFIFIATITLPHTIIRDKFYKRYLND